MTFMHDLAVASSAPVLKRLIMIANIQSVTAGMIVVDKIW